MEPHVYSKEAYAPFGEAETTLESGAQDRVFTGQTQDTTSGIYDYMFRKYDPTAGRWLSPDPAGWGAVDQTNPQSLDRYAYVLNNPMNAVDPLGLTCYVSSDGTWQDDGDGSGCALTGQIVGDNSGDDGGTAANTLINNDGANGAAISVTISMPQKWWLPLTDQQLLDQMIAYSSMTNQQPAFDNVQTQGIAPAAAALFTFGPSEAKYFKRQACTLRAKLCGMTVEGAWAERWMLVSIRGFCPQ